MSGIKLDNALNSIPNSFFDFIARICPGALAILCYGWNGMEGLQSVAGLSFGLIASYVLGLLMDVSSSAMFKVVSPGTIHWIARYPLLPFWAGMLDDEDLWPHLRAMPAGDQTLLRKMMAEKALFRNVMLVPFFGLLYPPAIVATAVHGRLVCLIVLAILIFAYLAIQSYVTDILLESTRRRLPELEQEHLRFLISGMAAEYNRCDSLDREIDHLANLGLLKRIRKFDEARNFDLSAYVELTSVGDSLARRLSFASNQNRLRRGWLRRCLARIAALLVLGMSLLVVFIAGWLYSRWSQSRAVDTFRSLGTVEIRFDYDFDAQAGAYVDGQPKAPQWLKYFVRDECLGEVEVVRFGNVQIADDKMSLLGSLRCLKELQISGSQSTSPASLAYLANLKRLKMLNVSKTRFTDETLKLISRLPRLQELNAGETRVTDSGLIYVKRMHDLRRLDLRSTQVTDQGLQHIGRLHKLAELDLTDTSITDSGLLELSSCAALKRLVVTGTQVTNEGLKKARAGLSKNCVVIN